MKKKKTQVKPKKTGGKNSKNTPMAPKISSIITQNELKELFEATKKEEYELISSKYSKKVSDARDKKYAADLFYRNLSGEFQEVQKSIFLPLREAKKKFDLDKTLEMIDAFLIFTQEQEKIVCLAKFEAMNLFFDMLNRSNDLEKQDDETLNFESSENDSDDSIEMNKSKTEFTSAQQCLAIYYLLNSLGIDMQLVDKSNIARLAHLLAGKFPPSPISNSNLYKRVKKVFDKSDKLILKDLVFVKTHFERLNTTNSIGIKRIIERIEKDIVSYSK